MVVIRPPNPSHFRAMLNPITELTGKRINVKTSLSLTNLISASSSPKMCASTKNKTKAKMSVPHLAAPAAQLS